MTILVLSDLAGPNPLPDKLPTYIDAAIRTTADENGTVVLTGRSPTWLYVKIAFALYGKVTRLVIQSPDGGSVVVFDHRLLTGEHSHAK